MDFIREHKQFLLNMALTVILAVIIVFGVYAKAVPAEHAPETADTAETDATAVSEESSAGRTVYDNCRSLQQLDLVDWDNDGVVKPERLETVANNAEGLAFALRLQNLESEVFAKKYDPPADVECPDWSKYYVGYGIHEKMVAPDFDGTAQLEANTYVEWTVQALEKQGFAVSAADFDQYLNQPLTYAQLGDLTYTALTYTKEENGAEVSFADVLADLAIIDRDAAVMADLPVAENTEDNYEKLFVDSLLNNSEPFVYTEKNKELMVKLMDDKTSLFALINQENTLTADYVPELVGSGNVQMNETADTAMTEMLAAAAKDNIRLNKKSGYRSYEKQKSLYGNGSNEYRAAPGASEHQTGLAMDLVNGAGVLDDKLANCIEAKWLADNCWKYGFIIRYTDDKEAITGYPAEWWHVRFVGKTIAWEIHNTGMAYEEFYEKCAEGLQTETDTAEKSSADDETAEDKAEPMN